MPANDNRRDVVTIKGTGPKTRPAKPSGSRTPPGIQAGGVPKTRPPKSSVSRKPPGSRPAKKPQ